MTKKTAEELIVKYGEKYRTMITSAVAFLEEREPLWKLDRPINRDAYIKSLIDRIAPEPPEQEADHEQL